MEDEEEVAISSDDHEAKKLKRTVKPLPPELEKVTTSNMKTIIHCALETYRQGNDLVEHVLAQYAEFQVEEGGATVPRKIDLQKDLNLCQLRRFCRHTLGLRVTASSTKHACRRAIALAISFEAELHQHGLHPRSAETRARNTLLRLVNVVLGSCFIDRFLELNLLKTRVDHETGNMVPDFWEEATTVYNDFADNDDGQLHIVNNSNDPDLKTLLLMEVEPINLVDADSLTADMMQKKIMTLLKIRRTMKENMEVSGTHSHTPLNFLDMAMNKTKGGRMLNRVGVYYFYVRASEYNELIDAAFQPFLSGEHKVCRPHVHVIFIDLSHRLHLL
jgi:hypothetical protein